MTSHQHSVWTSEDFKLKLAEAMVNWSDATINPFFKMFSGMTDAERNKSVTEHVAHLVARVVSGALTPDQNFCFQGLFFPESDEAKLPDRLFEDKTHLEIYDPSTSKLVADKWGNGETVDLFYHLDQIDQDASWCGDWSRLATSWDSKLEDIIRSDPIDPEVLEARAAKGTRSQYDLYDNHVTTMELGTEVLVIGSGNGKRDVQRVLSNTQFSSGDLGSIHLYDPEVKSQVKDGLYVNKRLKAVKVVNHGKKFPQKKFDVALMPLSIQYVLTEKGGLKRALESSITTYSLMPFHQGLASAHFLSQELGTTWRKTPSTVLLQAGSTTCPMVSFTPRGIIVEPSHEIISVMKKFVKEGKIVRFLRGDTVYSDGETSSYRTRSNKDSSAKGVVVIASWPDVFDLKPDFDFDYSRDTNTTYTRLQDLKFGTSLVSDVDAYISRPRPLQPHELMEMRYGGPYYVADKSDGVPGVFQVTDGMFIVHMPSQGNVLLPLNKEAYNKRYPGLKMSGQVEFIPETVDGQVTGRGKFVFISLQKLGGVEMSWLNGYAYLLGFRSMFPFMAYKPWWPVYHCPNNAHRVKEGFIIVDALSAVLCTHAKAAGQIRNISTSDRYVKRSYTVDVTANTASVVSREANCPMFDFSSITAKYPGGEKMNSSELDNRVAEFTLSGRFVRWRVDKPRSNHLSFIALQFSAVAFGRFVQFWSDDRKLYRSKDAWPKPLFTHQAMRGPNRGDHLRMLLDRYLAFSQYMMHPTLSVNLGYIRLKEFDGDRFDRIRREHLLVSTDPE